MARRKRPNKKRGLKKKLGESTVSQSEEFELYSQALEESRAEALGTLNLLDTSPEERFDRICRLAQDVMQAPATYISLIDRDRQWFKSTCGMPEVTETPREGTFCDYAIQRSRPTVVLNAEVNPLFAKSPYVTDGPKVRFYAGFPLMVRGQKVGTLCALDFEARTEVSDQQMDQLYDLARMAEQELTLKTEDAPDSMKSGIGRLPVTILNSKIDGLERILSALTPDTAASVMNLYLNTVRGVVARWQGTIEDFSGGDLRVLFKTEEDSLTHVALGAGCALEMQRAQADLNRVLAKDQLSSLAPRIALHCGEVLAHSALGKTALVGEVLQQAEGIRALVGEGQILASEKVIAILGDHALVAGRLKLEVAGFQRSTFLYELVGLELASEAENSESVESAGS